MSYLLLMVVQASSSTGLAISSFEGKNGKMLIAIFSDCYRLPIFPSFFDLRPDTEYVIMISRCSSCGVFLWPALKSFQLYNQEICLWVSHLYQSQRHHDLLVISPNPRWLKSFWISIDLASNYGKITLCLVMVKLHVFWTKIHQLLRLWILVPR